MTFVEQIRLGARHEGGIKMQPCLAVDPEWFSAIQDDVQNLLAVTASSSVNETAHPTHWTQPFGSVTQHSLYNDSGRTEDFSTDHNCQIEGKDFVAKDKPALYRLYALFAGRAMNFRLNGMLGRAGLSPHEENVIHGERTRLRFHLPLFTNPQAVAMLDGERFHLKAGYIYYFNNGCVHAAENTSDQPRYHLVWDVFYDDWIYENVCNLSTPSVPDPGLRKLTAREVEELSASEPWDVEEYITYDGRKHTYQGPRG